jgi:alpha-1,2-mannosyltransferase
MHGTDSPKAKNKKNPGRIVLICFIGILLGLNFCALYMNWLPTLSGQWGLTHKISGTPIGGDFSFFYAASHLILSGRTLEVFDPSILQAAINRTTGAQANYSWHYPPIFFLIVLPLALLPYLPSLFIWLGLTLGSYLWIIRRIAPHPLTLWLILAFPGAYINFLHGQNGFLTATILGVGLLFLDRRPRLAGLVLGLLCYKPHFAALVPVALIAGRRWQALVAAAISALTLMLISLLAFGPEVWQAFFASTDATFKLLENENLWKNWAPTTLFVTIRLWGGSVALAWTFQFVIMLLAVAVVVYVWRGSRETPPYIRNAVLVLTILLFTPYAHSYDLAILALPLAWLGWEWYSHGRLQFFYVCLLTLSYITPFFVYPFGELMHNFPLAPIVFMTLIFIALFRRRANKLLVQKAS